MDDNSQSNIKLDADVIAALEYAGLQEKFDALPPSHQREYIEWLDEAQSPETRDQRIEELCNKLKLAES